jgi:hypothetical protein
MKVFVVVSVFFTVLSRATDLRRTESALFPAPESVARVQQNVQKILLKTKVKTP